MTQAQYRLLIALLITTALLAAVIIFTQKLIASA